MAICIQQIQARGFWKVCDLLSSQRNGLRDPTVPIMQSGWVSLRILASLLLDSATNLGASQWQLSMSPLHLD